MGFPTSPKSNIQDLGARELEATERFFDASGLEQPRIPQLTPEFTNPLFLKLYCEGLRGLGLSAPPVGEEQISVVFDRYLKWEGKPNCAAAKA